MQKSPSLRVFTEEFRPTFHFTPEKNWINDPNGLLFYKGKYHLFYQHNPSGILWGNMSWGHSVSSDLQSWQHLPVAIPCTETTGIFSGSAVVDYKNTSGFGAIDNPPLVAIYTVHHNDGSNQSQHIAYSIDEGTTWTKYADNPVLDLGMTDFRDPKVSWNESTQSWLMTVAKPLEFKIAFFSSPDLKSWTHLSDFGPMAATGGCWECPDLFPLPTPSGDTQWVLIVSLNPGGITGGSGTQYFIGDWDGKIFIPSHTDTKWIDYGRDNYAGVTFSNTPDNRKIFLAWMSNWDYAAKLDSQVWRGSMTSPRELQIREVGNEFFLSALPISELKSEHDYHFAISSKEDSEITVSDGEEKVVIHFHSATKTISVDRSNAWFPQFEEKIQTTSPITLENFTIRLLLDHGSLELFVPEAALALTCLHTLPASSTVLQKPAKQLQ
ncbi:MAG: GH32 C-terminal domain-containing protein [Candidatus Planktophila sp.]